jgi:predicted DNA-binding protein with PD1-like motif
MMRQIKHPGPVLDSSSMALPSKVRLTHAELPVGDTLLTAVTRLLAALDSDSAVLRLSGGAFSNFCYYLPALSDHPEHAVFFSEKMTGTDQVMLEMATVTFGNKDGQPWLHCHAVWLEPGGKTLSGHLVPDEIVVSSPIEAEVCLIESVRFDALFDPETNFSIFKPLAVPAPQSTTWPAEETHDALVIRVIPNQDLCQTLEHLCVDQGWQKAQVQGGVGSLICADFADGRHVKQLATELLIERGRITPHPSGECRAAIDITLVDFEGKVNRGRIARQSNPVLVTCELVLVKQ